MHSTYIREGLRMLLRRVRVAATGFRMYHGDPSMMCHAMIRACWNQKHRFFQTSSGHFCQFYTRDFGWCSKSLVQLGYTAEVRSTLRYALHRFRAHGHITTTLTPQGHAFDFPYPAADSLPWMMHALTILDDKTLLEEFRPFLCEEIRHYRARVLDRHTGCVRTDRTFSSIKDHAIRKGSCYDTSCAALLSTSIDSLGWDNPLPTDYTRIIKEHYWNGSYFWDDLQRKNYIAGDAQIAPFWIGGITTSAMKRKAFSAVHSAGLDAPLPLRYTHGAGTKVRFIPAGFLASGYESDAIWAHLGLAYIEALAPIAREDARRHLASYTALLQKHRTFLEVLDSRGAPFRTPFYITDEGMLWCANYLRLIQNLST